MYRTMYHVFWDHHDEWTGHREAAEAFYVALGNVNKRLYKEEFAFEEDYLAGEPTLEECLYSDGEYPL